MTSVKMNRQVAKFAKTTSRFFALAFLATWRLFGGSHEAIIPSNSLRHCFVATFI